MRYVALCLLVIALSTPAACESGGDAAASDATLGPADDAGDVATIRLSGVTYALSATEGLAGVAVRVVEYPELATTSDGQGRYALDVPAGAPFTPYASREGFLDVHQRTFDGEVDVERVHFQLIPPAVLGNYAAMFGVEPDPERCQIVIGVSSRAIQAMDFGEIITVGNDGVAGVKVTAEPPISVTYFFRGEGPPTTTPPETSGDSNLICPNVAPGAYVVRGTHPAHTFEPLSLTCEPGRLVNASRPWGLRER